MWKFCIDWTLFSIIFDKKQLEAMKGIHKRKIFDGININEEITKLRNNDKNKITL